MALEATFKTPCSERWWSPGDPRADHLYYTLWVNRSQPVNAYSMKAPRDKDGMCALKRSFPT
jgi:hypothetical protein